MEKILIQIRRQLGWSQTEMASVLGVSRSQYAMAESGKRSLNPNAILLVLKLNEKTEQGQKGLPRLPIWKGLVFAPARFFH